MALTTMMIAILVWLTTSKRQKTCITTMLSHPMRSLTHTVRQKRLLQRGDGIRINPFLFCRVQRCQLFSLLLAGGSSVHTMRILMDDKQS